MRKFFLRIGNLLPAVVLLFAVPIFAQEAAQEDSAELQKVREVVSERFAEISPEEIFESQIPGWYTIRKGAIVAYISADGRYLLQGDMIDLESNANLTEESRNDARVKMMSDVPNEQLIVFTPEKVEATVSIFTDIDCTFCRRLHSQLDEYMAEGIEIR